MNKKQIIIMAGLGLICFAASFTVGLFTRTKDEPVITDGVPGDAQTVETLAGTDNPGDNADAATAGNSFQAKQVDLNRSLSERQLKSLISEMRSKLSDFSAKEKMLKAKEARIQMSIKELQKNVMGMEDLRVKLTAIASSIKQNQKVLDDKLVRIEDVEKKNIMKTSAIYDKMKPQQASEIMINLAASNQLDYAVKITYYMTDRTSANLIAEISETQPNLAATISDKMRWIENVKP